MCLNSNSTAARDDAVTVMGSAEEYQAIQMEEYKRICKMLKFVHQKNDLDTRISFLMYTIMKWPLSLEQTDFSRTNLSDMSLYLPAVDSVLKPECFLRTTLVIRFQRRILDLHQINPISEDAVFSIADSRNSKDDPRVLKKIWFFLFLGAEATEIKRCLKHILDKPSLSVPPGLKIYNKFTHIQLRRMNFCQAAGDVPRSEIECSAEAYEIYAIQLSVYPQILLNNSAASQNNLRCAEAHEDTSTDLPCRSDLSVKYTSEHMDGAALGTEKLCQSDTSSPVRNSGGEGFAASSDFHRRGET